MPEDLDTMLLSKLSEVFREVPNSCMSILAECFEIMSLTKGPLDEAYIIFFSKNCSRFVAYSCFGGANQDSLGRDKHKTDCNKESLFCTLKRSAHRFKNSLLLLEKPAKWLFSCS